MNRTLILGQIPDNFSPELHIPAKPACFLGKEYIYPNFHEIDFTEAVEKKEDFPILDKMVNDEALSLVKVVAQHYYPHDFEKHPFRFWKYIFYPWLSLYVPYLYWEQLLAEKIIERYRMDEIEVRSPKKRKHEFQGYSSVTDMIENGLKNPRFNEYISSLFFRALAPKSWRLYDYEPVQITIEALKTKIGGYQKLFNNSIDKWLYRAKLSYGFSLFDRIIIHYLLKLKKPIKSNSVTNPELPVLQIKWAIDVKDLIIRHTPSSLKNIHLSDLPRKYKQGKCVSYSNQLYFKSSLDAAFASQAGEIVIADQHGGHLYGSAVSSESVFNVEYSADYFISWGWKKYNNAILNNVIPLPSPLLSKLQNKHKASNKLFMFVGTSMSLLSNRFIPAFSDIEMLNYRLNKLEFITNYKKEFGLESLIYRPYHESNYSLEDSSFLLKSFPDLLVQRSSKKNFLKFLSGSECLILDHPGTTLNIAMAMNIPVLMFWKKEWFPFNDESIEFLDNFFQLGIYHKDTESLIQKISQIKKSHNTFSNWWSQEEIQLLRKNWMKKYALSDRNWRKIWIKNLLELA